MPDPADFGFRTSEFQLFSFSAFQHHPLFFQATTKSKMTTSCLVTRLVAFTMLAQIASARVGELEAEIAQRYGEPVSPYAYQQVNRDAVFEGIHSSSHLGSIEENERDEETDLINLAEITGFQFSDGRLVFFDPEMNKWNILQSSILGRRTDPEDSQEIKKLAATANKHLKQRFYIVDDISISVIYMGGRSVSESYKQKNVMFGKEEINSFVEKSFPDAEMIEEGDFANQGAVIIRLLSEKGEVVGCATYLDGALKISAYPFYAFLHAMELGLKNHEETIQERKLEKF